MGRFRPPSPPGADADEDIRALMADIDASMADLEQRLEESRRHGAGRGRDTRLPAVNLPAEAAPAAPAAPEPAAHHESNLLAELAQEAAQKDGSGSAEADRLARNRLISEALQQIFSYLDQFARLSSKLSPRIDRPYRLDTQTVFADLTWVDAFADFRKQDLTENALLAHVGFRARLAAPAPLVVARRWDQLDALRKEMQILALRQMEEDLVVPGTVQEMVQVRLAPDFPMLMRFRGNYEEGRIDVLARNIEGFGIAAFELDPQAVDQALLDGIGRFLLFRSNKLPEALRRVQFFREDYE